MMIKIRRLINKYCVNKWGIDIAQNKVKIERKRNTYRIEKEMKLIFPFIEYFIH